MLDCHFYSLFTFTLLLSFSSLPLCEERTEQEFYFLPYISEPKMTMLTAYTWRCNFSMLFVLGVPRVFSNFFLTLLQLFLNLSKRFLISSINKFLFSILFFFLIGYILFLPTISFHISTVRVMDITSK